MNTERLAGIIGTVLGRTLWTMQRIRQRALCLRFGCALETVVIGHNVALCRCRSCRRTVVVNIPTHTARKPVAA